MMYENMEELRKELESGGFIERIQSGRNQSIKISNKGFGEVINDRLKRASNFK